MNISQQTQPTRKDLLNAIINQQVSVVQIKEVRLEAKQPVPQHFHPYPVVGYIASGSVLFQVEGEESKILNERDAFYEPRNKVILHFDNASGEKPLVFIAFYLKELDEENITIL